MKTEGSEPSGREYAHKLLECFEWLTNIEFDIHSLNVDEICSKWGEMVGIIPLP